MKFVDVSVVSVEDALATIEREGEKEGWEKAKVESAEPGSPETVFWNV
jgi:leucyl-tRNA synthetase